MAFLDETSLFVASGKGGDGAASFHSEPYKPRGGPDGGDGGNGGSVILQVARGVRDLSELAAHPHRRAEPGKPGRRANRSGGNGKDLVVPVPDGTVVRDERGFVADLVGEGARVVVARGGQGGRGNAALSGPHNRVPRNAEAGQPGEDRSLELEVRTIADVGLVGLPNAGKSTLLAALTAATPKVAAYPFTTLGPNIGVAEGEERFVIADVPGLIEGAHEGRGLGLRFLRHVSRCSVIAYVVDLSSAEPATDLATVKAELLAYDPALMERAEVVVATHSDLLDEHERSAALGALAATEPVVVSGVTGEGIELLAVRLSELAGDQAAQGPVQKPRAVVLRPGREEFTVTKEGPRFRVAGRFVERWVAETDLDEPREVGALQKKFLKEGIERMLQKAGARRGDEVVIGDTAFEFIPADGPVEGGS